MTSTLDALGIQQEERTKATGEVGKEFQIPECGIYKATVKNVHIWTNKFGNKSMRYVVTVNLPDGEKDYIFKTDISSVNKDGKQIKEYVDRWVQFCYATGVDEKNITFIDAPEKINSFGTDIDTAIIPEFKGKSVAAILRQWNDTNKTDGESYKLTTHLFGVLAPDGTDATGENKTEKIKELCAKGPIDYKGYVADKGKQETKAQTPSKEVQDAAANVGF